MKIFWGKFKYILLGTLLLLGIDSLVGAIVFGALSDLWPNGTGYGDHGFWVDSIDAITTIFISAVVFGLVGLWILVKKLKLFSLKQLLLVAGTFAALYLLYVYVDYGYYLFVPDSPEDIEWKPLFNFLDWMGLPLVAFVSSFWLLKDRLRDKPTARKKKS